MPAPKGNQFAAKAPEERIWRRGRITADLGALKARCQRAAQARKLKLTAWIREKLDQAARDEGH